MSGVQGSGSQHRVFNPPTTPASGEANVSSGNTSNVYRKPADLKQKTSWVGNNSFKLKDLIPDSFKKIFKNISEIKLSKFKTVSNKSVGTNPDLRSTVLSNVKNAQALKKAKAAAQAKTEDTKANSHANPSSLSNPVAEKSVTELKDPLTEIEKPVTEKKESTTPKPKPRKKDAMETDIKPQVKSTPSPNELFRQKFAEKKLALIEKQRNEYKEKIVEQGNTPQLANGDFAFEKMPAQGETQEHYILHYQSKEGTPHQIEVGINNDLKVALQNFIRDIER